MMAVPAVQKATTFAPLLAAALVAVGISGLVLIERNKAAAIAADALYCMGGDAQTAPRAMQIACNCLAHETAHNAPPYRYIPVLGGFLVSARTMSGIYDRAIETCRGSPQCTAPCVIENTSDAIRPLMGPDAQAH